MGYLTLLQKAHTILTKVTYAHRYNLLFLSYDKRNFGY